MSSASVSPFLICNLSIFQDSGHPPTWICKGKYETTHEKQLVTVSCVQNLIAIDWSSVDMQVSILCESAWKRLFAIPFWGVFGVKWGTMKSFQECSIRRATSFDSNRVRFSLGMRAKISVKKDFSHLPNASTGAITEFWHTGWYRRPYYTCQILSTGSQISEFWRPQFSPCPQA